MKRYRTMVEFFNKLWNEGLLHPEYATMSDADWSSLFYGKCEAGIAVENIGWNIYTCRQVGIDTGKDFYIQSPTIDGERVLWPNPSQVNLSFPMVISAKSQNIDAAVRLLDYMFSTEGADLITFGKEGVDWKVGEDGKRCILSYKLHEYGTNPEDYCEGKIIDSPSTVELYFNGSIFNRVQFHVFDDNWKHLAPPPDYADRWDYAFHLYDDAGSMTDPIPPVTLNAEDLDVTTNVGTALDTLVMEETQKFIEAAQPPTDEEWEAFTTQVTELGAQQVVDVWNGALARLTK